MNKKPEPMKPIIVEKLDDYRRIEVYENVDGTYRVSLEGESQGEYTTIRVKDHASREFLTEMKRFRDEMKRKYVPSASLI